MNSERKYGVIIALSMCSTALPIFFMHDRAVYAAQKGDMPRAYTFLQSLVTDHPDNSEVLYDAGVAAYKQQKFDEAEAYFKKVSQSAQSPTLQQQAYFNMGNVAMMKKKYQDAVDAYTKVLQGNPNNKEAHHNREIALQKLREEQQKQEEQKQHKNNDQQNNEKENKKDSQQKSDGSENKQSPGQESQQEDNSKGSQDQQEDQGDQKNTPSKDGKTSRKRDAKQNEEKGEQEDDASSDEGSADQSDYQRKADNQLEKNGESDQQGEKQSDDVRNQGDDKPAKKDPIQKNYVQSVGNSRVESLSSEQAQAFAGSEQDKEIFDENMLNALNTREKSDAHQAKKMIKVHVNNTMAGQHGENCW